MATTTVNDFELKIKQNTEEILDTIDQRIDKLLGTIELKLQHVSKQFNAKLETITEKEADEEAADFYKNETEIKELRELVEKQIQKDKTD